MRSADHTIFLLTCSTHVSGNELHENREILQYDSSMNGRKARSPFSRNIRKEKKRKKKMKGLIYIFYYIE